jgi:HlyD family secretion protein
MSSSADIQTTTHVNVLSVPINSVAVREKGTDNAVSGGGDESDNNNGGGGAAAPAASSGSGNTDLDEVVFLVEPGDTVRKVLVHTDIQDINYIEVTDGIKEGDQVVSGPYSVISKTLRSGMMIKVVPKDKLFTDKKN